MKKLLDWGHTVEFEVSGIDLLYKVKMKSGGSMINGEGQNFWQALTIFLTNANFYVASLKIENRLEPLASMVMPEQKVELARKGSSLSVKINGKPVSNPSAEALRSALA